MAGDVCQHTKTTIDGRVLTCGQVHDPKKCTAHKNLREDPDDRTSRIIGIRPCQASPVNGLEVCVAHGGRSRQAKAKAAERVAEEKAAIQRGRPADPDVAERRANALKLRMGGASYSDIAQELGYPSADSAGRDIRRALALTVSEPAEELRALELLRLDEALQRLADDEEKVRSVRDREHLTVSHGKVIYVRNDEGAETPLIDDAPVLQANAQLMAIEDRRNRIQERRAKLVGLDAPRQLEVVTLDAIDQQIRALTDELERVDAATAELDGTEAPETAGAEASQS